MPTIISDWLCRNALPLWSECGWDESSHLFVERLALDGSPLRDVARRVMVQARQIFVFSVSHQEGWWPAGADLACSAGRSLVTRFQADGQPGWAFAVDRDGAIVDQRRDLYAQAFVLLALAHLTRIDGDRRWLAHADATLDFLDRSMATLEFGGYVECVPHRDGPRRQNPHMHLFEALLALHEADPAGGYLERAGRVLDLLEDRFLCGKPPVLAEYFDADWSPRGAPIQAFEPGHHFEWAWLLVQHATLGGRDSRDLATSLWERASCLGVAPNGLIYDEVRADGHILKSSTRLWALAEAAKAATCGLVGSAGDTTRCDAFLEALHRAFLAPASRGSWFDHLDVSGNCAVGFVPASSLYHICGAAQEAERSQRVNGSGARHNPDVSPASSARRARRC